MSFIKFKRDSDFDIHKHPFVFNLLAIIARRAKRTESFGNKSLDYGEALLGDYKNYGMSRQQYRRSLVILKLANQITIKSTNKGTIVKLVSTDYFDINIEENEQLDNHLENQQTTNKQPLTKNDKKEKNISLYTSKTVKGDENQSLYKSLITYCATKGGQGHFTNYPKQLKYTKILLETPHTVDEIRFVIDSMAGVQFWQENTFDMYNVYSNFDREINKFRPVSKGGSYVKSN